MTRGQRGPQYGVDAPGALAGLGAGAAVTLASAGAVLRKGWRAFGITLLASGLLQTFSTLSFLYTSNGESATRRNADAAGVGDRIELVTADMQDLPLPDGSVDVVVSSLAIH